MAKFEDMHNNRQAIEAFANEVAMLSLMERKPAPAPNKGVKTIEEYYELVIKTDFPFEKMIAEDNSDEE